MRNIPEENRPIRFSDVVGQKTPIKILKGMGKSGNYAPVYVFEGLKGSGKTTDARILARAVNCLNRTEDGEPCCTCANCKKILAGESLDVIEIDAASHNSVADARQLLEEACYRPVELPKKVYILDEAHRMTNEAFDVLLKLLEEPPEWCIFILCTTERAKIRETVLSRSIVLTFKAASQAEMSERLKDVAIGYGATLTDGGAEIICRHSGGSMRDAFTDLAICLEESVEITEESASEALGVDSASEVFGMIEAINGNKVGELIKYTNHYFDSGRFLDRVLLDAVRALSDIVLFREGAYENGSRSPEYESMLTASTVTKQNAIYISRALADTRKSISDISERSLFAVELIRIAAHIEVNYDVVLAELDELKKKVDALESRTVISEPVTPSRRTSAEDTGLTDSMTAIRSSSEHVNNLSSETVKKLILPNDDDDDEDDEDETPVSVYENEQTESFRNSMMKEDVSEKTLEAEGFTKADDEDVPFETEETVTPAGQAEVPESGNEQVPDEKEDICEDVQDLQDSHETEERSESDAGSSLFNDDLFDMFDSFFETDENPAAKLATSLKDRVEEAAQANSIFKKFLSRMDSVEYFADCVEAKSSSRILCDSIRRNISADWTWFKVIHTE